MTDPVASGKPPVEVVAGIIFSTTQDAVLVALRQPDQHQGDRWEFPGGKVEAGESLTDALARELEEEIGITPRASTLRCTLQHDYPDKSVRLHFFDVTRFSGKPVSREAQEIRWVALSELAALPFPAANQPVVDEMLARCAIRCERQ